MGSGQSRKEIVRKKRSGFGKWSGVLSTIWLWCVVLKSDTYQTRNPDLVALCRTYVRTYPSGNAWNHDIVGTCFPRIMVLLLRTRSRNISSKVVPHWNCADINKDYVYIMRISSTHFFSLRCRFCQLVCNGSVVILLRRLVFGMFIHVNCTWDALQKAEKVENY